MILVKNGENWKEVEAHGFEYENALQSLLAKHPETIPIVKFGLGRVPIVLGLREVPISTGYIDILGFDREGGITIVECKKATNDQLRREVVGQILDYAASLYGLRYQDLDEICECDSGQELVDAILGASGAEPDEVQRNQLKAALDKTLRDGTFRLIIVSDGLRRSLASIVEYMGHGGPVGANLCVLELQRYEDGETEVIVPLLHGRPHRSQEHARAPIADSPWYDCLLRTRLCLEQGEAPEGSVLYPARKKVGRWLNGPYVQLNPREEGKGLRTFLWADPDNDAMYLGLHEPTGGVPDLVARLKEAFGAQVDYEESENNIYVSVADAPPESCLDEEVERLTQILSQGFMISSRSEDVR